MITGAPHYKIRADDSSKWTYVAPSPACLYRPTDGDGDGDDDGTTDTAALHGRVLPRTTIVDDDDGSAEQRGTLPKTCVGVVGTALVVSDDNGCMLDLLFLFLSFIYLRHPST